MEKNIKKKGVTNFMDEFEVFFTLWNRREEGEILSFAELEKFKALQKKFGVGTMGIPSR